MKKLVTVAVAMLVASAVFAQQVVLRTDGIEGKSLAETAIYFGENADLWVQNFDDMDKLTLRGGPFQKIGHGWKASEFIGWTPETGALSLNPNLGHSYTSKSAKTFWEAGLYAPLNSKSSWSLVMYDARWLHRFSDTVAVGPVGYAKWAEGAGNDFFALGAAIEVKPRGNNGCFYSRYAHNFKTGGNEFRFQYSLPVDLGF